VSLAAHADDFSKNLDVEAIALGFRIDFLFGLGQILDLIFDLLNALNERSQLIARNVNWSAGWRIFASAPSASGAGQLN